MGTPTGRIHHCMRLIGQAERSLSLMCGRVTKRVVFGKKLSQISSILQGIAKSRVDIDTCRLLVHRAASLMDERGNKDPETRQLLSLVKGHVPLTVQTLVDRSMQAFGAMGLSQDVPLFASFAGARWLRLADGPDEVHLRTAGRIELMKQKHSPLYNIGPYPVDRTRVFRRTTDPVSRETQLKLEEYSRL